MPSLAVVVLSFEKEMYILTEGDKPVEVCLITEGEGLPMHSISVPIKFINRTAICKCQAEQRTILKNCGMDVTCNMHQYE